MLIISLYYWKLSSSSPKGYLTATDVNSNCDATIYCGVAISNIKIWLVQILTSHSLYYRKLCLNAHEAKRVYIQAKLMLIQTVMPQFIVDLHLANGLQTSWAKQHHIVYNKNHFEKVGGFASHFWLKIKMWW